MANLHRIIDYVGFTFPKTRKPAETVETRKLFGVLDYVINYLTDGFVIVGTISVVRPARCSTRSSQPREFLARHGSPSPNPPFPSRVVRIRLCAVQFNRIDAFHAPA